MSDSLKSLSQDKKDELIGVLKDRFEKNMNRHKNLEWTRVQAKLESNPSKLWSLHEMEKTGGEPDIISHDKKTDEYIFYDCAEQSPEGRRYVCYDHEGQKEREKKKSTKVVKSGGLAGNAIDMADAMGIEILTEVQYRDLQKIGEFDTKTSSWVKTPEKIRDLGGAIFCTRRYDTVFMFHNSAPSYYGDRGFRGSLRV